MSFPPYACYKNSGVEWLGEVPEHWKLLPLCGVATERDEPNVGMVENNLLSLSYGKIVRKDMDSNDGLLPESFETYQIVRRGDIVLRLTDLQNDKRSLRSALAEETGIITSAYLAITPREVLSAYLSYLLRAYDAAKVFYSMGGGLRQSMKFDELKRMPVLVPPEPEQAAIASVLDHETAKLNVLIAEQQRLIEVLQEKWEADISHAVTKGLNPDAPVKPSGVEWLGEVPAHWDVVRLGRKIELQRGIDITKDEQNPGTVPVVSSGGIASFHDRALVNGPGVVVGRKGTAGAVYYVTSAFWPHDTTLYVRNFGGNVPRYVYYKLLSMNLASYDTGSANPTINRNLVHPVLVSWPPVTEQKVIADFLAQESTKLDNLVSEAENGISLMAERRTSLISAAVTGKIDVRGFASAATA